MFTDTQLNPFFQTLVQPFLETSRCTLTVPIGPCFVSFIYSHSLLNSHLHRSLSHLGSSQKPAQWQLICCDSACSDFTLPPPPFSVSQLTGSGLIADYHSDRFKLHFDMGTGALSIVDLKEKIAFYWVKDAHRIKWWQRGSPFQLILHLILQQENCQLTHAAAVATTKGAVLLLGRGGSGKSTTALNCLHHGFRFIGEDYVILSAGPPYRVYSVYQSLKLTSQTISMFPSLYSAIDNTPDPEEKRLVFMDALSSQLNGVTPLLNATLSALILCKIGEGNHNQLCSVSASDILPGLSVSTMRQLIYTGKQTLSFFQTLSGSLPTYQLELHTQNAEVPALIEGCL